MTVSSLVSNEKEKENENLRTVTYLSKLKRLSLFIKEVRTIEKTRTLLNFLKKSKFLQKGTKKLVSTSHEINHSLHNVAHHNINRLLNVIAYGYVVYDTYYHMKICKNHGGSNKEMLLIGVDTMIFHYFASNLLPGLMISLVLKGNHYIFSLFSSYKVYKYSKYVGVLLALLSIPLMIKPIDMFTERILHCSYRKYFGIEKYFHH